MTEEVELLKKELEQRKLELEGRAVELQHIRDLLSKQLRAALRNIRDLREVNLRLLRVGILVQYYSGFKKITWFVGKLGLCEIRCQPFLTY